MSKKKATSQVATRDADKFNLRFPEGMRAQVADAAQRNGRSMNTEIITRLADSFEADGKGDRRALLETFQREFDQIKLELAKLRELVSTKK